MRYQDALLPPGVVQLLLVSCRSQAGVNGGGYIDTMLAQGSRNVWVNHFVQMKPCQHSLSHDSGLSAFPAAEKG